MEHSQKSQSNRVLTCFLFGEGKKDAHFIERLIEIDKFKYHTSGWSFSTDHGSGNSPRVILETCRKIMANRDYDLSICFIDQDVLKLYYPRKWEEKKRELEEEFNEIVIFWHEDNLEDELDRVLHEKKKSKKILNKKACKNPKKFINSNYWDRILKIIHDYEENEGISRY